MAEIGPAFLDYSRESIVNYHRMKNLQQNTFQCFPPLLLSLHSRKRRLEDSGEENGDSKKEKLWQKDEELVQNLIKNLPDTNDKVFTVPALPGDDTDTVIYNRSCYGYLRDFILKDKLLNRYCITGNPGIGKSYFGRLMLVELLKQQKSVLIDYEGFTAWIEPNGSILRIKDEDRSTYRQVVGQKDVWCIIDSLMPKFNHDLAGKFILVSSPKKQVIEKFTKAQKSKKFYMPTWDINELYDCQEKLYKEVDRNLIGKKFELCGGIARWIFDTAMTSNDIKLIIGGAISDNNLRSMLRSQGELFSGDEFSHKLIHIKSDNKAEIPYTKAECVFASQFVEDECLRRFQKNHIEDLRAFIEDSKNIAEMSVLRGKMFEMWSHAKICKGGDISKEFSDIKDVNIRPGVYYQPFAKNYQSIDSFMHPNFLFQITIADRHGVKQEKLKEFKDKNILNQGDEIRLYFIVPEESFLSYKKQNYLDGSKKAENVPKWIQNIKQYALCMNCDKY
ncbi:hypothetical protein C1646_678189 [Rhizophagus diaphanus]|nr:hypothetical protein C1646_678189 [Rhizophagus diaphanus] [Rhizophagus sp. MUCL 43196]